VVAPVSRDESQKFYGIWIQISRPNYTTGRWGAADSGQFPDKWKWNRHRCIDAQEAEDYCGRGRL